MTLPAQYDVRWLETANAFERHMVEWLDEDFEPWNQSTKNSPNFARARALAINGVVDEIN